MPSYREPTHADRVSQAATARKNALAAYRRSPALDPAAIEARQAELRQREEARAVRAQEKERIRALRAAEQAEADAALAREAAALAEARALEAVELAARQKAARDARYSARKARAR